MFKIDNILSLFKDKLMDLLPITYDTLSSLGSLPPDVIRLIALLSPQVFNRLARLNKRYYGIVIQIISQVGLCPPTPAEIVRYFSKNTDRILGLVSNAGAVFINTGEAFADYGMTGGNHILPTGGTARFLSGLSAYDFMVRTYIEEMSDKEQKGLSKLVAEFADIEGLEAHSNAAKRRGEER